MKINIFESEKDIEALIMESNACHSIASLLIDDKFTKADNYYDNDTPKKNYDALTLDPDLALLHAILVSTNWNRNDDVFSPNEVWKARITPQYKPANMDHQGQESDGKNKTIGVIFDCVPVNNDYQPINLSNDQPSIPDFFHLLVSIYLWERYWPTFVNEIKHGIADKNMFVSMECFFADFGYALREKDSENITLMNRNAETAWLTKYLRAYKGTGVVVIDGVEYQIGRWLKNLIFSGVGFVPKPGNPDSIIFDDFISHVQSKAVFNENNILDGINIKKIDILNQNCVLNVNQGKLSLWQT